MANTTKKIRQVEINNQTYEIVPHRLTDGTHFVNLPTLTKQDNTLILKENVIDSLSTTATDLPLSAGQGKWLNDNKLNLTGGKMTGPIIIGPGDGNGLLIPVDQNGKPNGNINVDGTNQTVLGFYDGNYILGSNTYNTTIRGGQTYITGSNLDIGNTGNSGLIAKGVSTNTDYTTIHTTDNRVLFLQEGNSGVVNIGGTPSTTAVQDMSAKLIVNGDIKEGTQLLKDKYQETLVSGVNIKTINGNSLLGKDDLLIKGEKGDPFFVFEVDEQGQLILTYAGQPVEKANFKLNDKGELIYITNPKDINSTQFVLGNVIGPPGITPTIGPNEHWFLGSHDTGKPSRGPQGRTPVLSFNKENGHLIVN